MRARLAMGIATGVVALAGAVGLTLMAQRAQGEAPQAAADDSEATAEGTASAVDGSNRFALDLYRQLRADPGNVFFSPYSVSTALSMVQDGAKGKTADEIRNVFRFSCDDAQRRSAFAALHNTLNEPDAQYQLSVANALWAQEQYAFLPDYISTVKRYYASEAANLDFASDTEAARLRINGWVEDKTNHKIKDLFAPGMIDPTTRLVLTNAVYFKGTWAAPFDKDATQDADFTLVDGGKVSAPLMRLTGEEAKFPYAEADGLQALELPYEGDKLSMLVLLPRDGDLFALEDKLSSAKLDEWRQALSPRRVNVYLPKFTFDTEYQLSDTLAQLGMPSAFVYGQADFSGMDNTRDLYIGIVVHKAFVDVNEEGTEAAAATGVGMRAGSAMNPTAIPEFRADHPFLFLIQDRESGLILFLGRVENPI